MTRAVLPNYPTLELPTIGGDTNVWGSVLNTTISGLSGYIGQNEDNIDTIDGILDTITGSDQVVGSVDYKIAQAVAGLRGTSTATLESLETLIGEGGEIDLTSITTAITNLQNNLGAPTSSTLSTSVYTRATTNSSAISTLIGGTEGDDALSCRAIAQNVVDNSDLGMSTTAVGTAITNAISGVTGASTKTIADLVTLITDLTTRVATLEQTVETLSSSKASQTDLDALELTVNGATVTVINEETEEEEEVEVDGLTTLVAAASLNASNAKVTAQQAENAVTTLSTSVTGLGTRVGTLESAGYITQSALTNYASQQWVIDKKYLTAVPDGYATETWVENKNYLTAVPTGYATETWVENKNYLTSTTGFVTTSDTDWKKVKGMFSGVANTTSLLPAQIYLSATSSTYRNRLSYNTNNEFIQTLESQAGDNQTAKALVNVATDLSGYVPTSDSDWLTLKGLIGTNYTTKAPTTIYLRQDSSNYVKIDVNSTGGGGTSATNVWPYFQVYKAGSLWKTMDIKPTTWEKLHNLVTGENTELAPEYLYINAYSSTYNNYGKKFIYLYAWSNRNTGHPVLATAQYAEYPDSGVAQSIATWLTGNPI